MLTDHVPHSIFITPLRAFDIWPENPNNPIVQSGNINKLQQINTYDTWHVVPLSRPVVNPPAFKENYLDLAGAYGSLDYSRAHSGLSIYGNRTGQWEFVVLNDFRSWEEAYSDIQHTIHGRRCFITLEDDPEYFYVGNLTLNSWQSDPGWSRIVINYNLEPYKYLLNSTIFSLSLSGYNTVGVNLNPTLLGRGPVHPWIKLTPANTDNPMEVNMLFANTELNLVREMKLTTSGQYISMPEVILSNESGTNEAALTFTGTESSSQVSPISIDIFYRRRYM